MISASKLIRTVRYQYHNDPLFKMRVDKSETVNLDSFMIQLLLNPKLKRDYLIQYGAWKNKMKKMMREAKKLMKEMNAERANVNKE